MFGYFLIFTGLFVGWLGKVKKTAILTPSCKGIGSVKIGPYEKIQIFGVSVLKGESRGSYRQRDNAIIVTTFSKLLNLTIWPPQSPAAEFFFWAIWKSFSKQTEFCPELEEWNTSRTPHN